MPDASRPLPASPEEECTIARVLAARASAIPEAIAIAAPGRPSLTYGALWQHVEETMRELRALGVGRQERVALVMPAGPEAAVAWLAVAACATSVPLNPAYSAEEFASYLPRLGVRALLVQGRFAPAARAAARAQVLPFIELEPTPESAAGVFTLHGRVCSHPAPPGYAQPKDVAVVLHTSGTTARPKVVPLTHANLIADARATAGAHALTAADRCLNITPLFHVHGLRYVLLASLVVGASVVFTPGFDPERFLDWLAAFQPTWHNAVPALHQAVLTQARRRPGGIGQHRLRFIKSSAASLPSRLRAELEMVFQVPVLEAYGTTETGNAASTPLPPAVTKAGSVGLVSSEAEVATMDAAGGILPAGQSGEIVVRGPMVFSGYENDPDANAHAFTNGWFRTGDEGYVDAEGYLFLTGRVKELINRGGEKISPLEVDEALLSHPAVAEAAAFAMPDAALGETVAAAVVLRPGRSASEAELRAHVASRLAYFKVPDRIVVVDALPLGATGKVVRRDLAGQLGLLAPEPRPRSVRQPFRAPRTPVEERVAAVWAEVLELGDVGVDDHFLELAGDSLRAAQVVARLQQAFPIDVAIADFFTTPTVAAMALVITQRLAAQLEPEVLAQLTAEFDREAPPATA